MDIDIKNAYDDILSFINKDSIEDLYEIIFCYFKLLFNEKAKEKFNYFRKIYIGECMDIESDDIVDIDSFNKNINKLINKQNDKDKFTNKLQYLLKAIGESYIFNSSDKNNVNKEAYIDVIGNLQKGAQSNHIMATDKNQVKKPITLNEEKNEAKDRDINTIEDTTSLEDLIKELDSQIGLTKVKDEVKRLINLIAFKKKGIEFGKKEFPISLHLVFYGSPGTGKTTIARLLARIYKKIGVLSKGQFIETNRADLVAGYVGQTAIKTKEKIELALGGILFIDEAYTLTDNKGSNDFGQEAVDTLLTEMENHRDDFIVIVAGYTEKMQKFIASNPGLESRFPKAILFEDYTSDELQKIFRLMCNTNEFIIDKECDVYLKEYFDTLYEKREGNNGNGRGVRNYFEYVLSEHINRLKPSENDISKEEYEKITLADCTNAAINYEKNGKINLAM